MYYYIRLFIGSCFLFHVVLEIVNKRGKVAVITGGARGIGLEIVKKLVQCEMRIVIGTYNIINIENDCFMIRK